jgi:DNA-binding IclR family transcriptional regulator
MNKGLSSTVDNAMKVLDLLGKSPYEYRISDLERKLDISRTSINRILLTLEKNNMVIRNPETKRYKIGPFAYHLGCVYLDNGNYENKVIEILNKICDELRVSAGLAKREGDNVISLFSVDNLKPFKINYVPGTFFPMNRGCYGKCLMAYHDRDRVKKILKGKKFRKISENTITNHEELLKEYDKIVEQGYVVSVDETFPSAVGVGIPIFSKDGTVKHCVAVSFIKDDNFDEKIDRAINLLFEYRDDLTNLIP